MGCAPCAFNILIFYRSKKKCDLRSHDGIGHFIVCILNILNKFCSSIHWCFTVKVVLCKFGTFMSIVHAVILL
jgi:uncharacterized membrane protein YvlD (DUF360 family)